MGDEGDTYGPYTVQGYRELDVDGESVAYYPNLTTAAATHIRHRCGRRTTTSTTRFQTFAELSGTNMRASRAGRTRLLGGLVTPPQGWTPVSTETVAEGVQVPRHTLTRWPGPPRSGAPRHPRSCPVRTAFSQSPGRHAFWRASLLMLPSQKPVDFWTLYAVKFSLG
jgi:hypothetical protein